MTEEMLRFWEEVREFLQPDFGQEPSARNRHKFEARKELAEQLGLKHKTLTSFLNGNQKGLGAEALNRLLQIYPHLKERLPGSLPQMQLRFPKTLS